MPQDQITSRENQLGKEEYHKQICAKLGRLNWPESTVVKILLGLFVLPLLGLWLWNNWMVKSIFSFHAKHGHDHPYKIIESSSPTRLKEARCLMKFAPEKEVRNLKALTEGLICAELAMKRLIPYFSQLSRGGTENNNKVRKLLKTIYDTVLEENIRFIWAEDATTKKIENMRFTWAKDATKKNLDSASSYDKMLCPNALKAYFSKMFPEQDMKDLFMIMVKLEILPLASIVSFILNPGDLVLCLKNNPPVSEPLSKFFMNAEASSIYMIHDLDSFAYTSPKYFNEVCDGGLTNPDKHSPFECGDVIEEECVSLRQGYFSLRHFSEDYSMRLRCKQEPDNVSKDDITAYLKGVFKRQPQLVVTQAKRQYIFDTLGIYDHKHPEDFLDALVGVMKSVNLNGRHYSLKLQLPINASFLLYFASGNSNISSDKLDRYLESAKREVYFDFSEREASFVDDYLKPIIRDSAERGAYLDFAEQEFSLESAKREFAKREANFKGKSYLKLCASIIKEFREGNYNYISIGQAHGFLCMCADESSQNEKFDAEALKQADESSQNEKFDADALKQARDRCFEALRKEKECNKDDLSRLGLFGAETVHQDSIKKAFRNTLLGNRAALDQTKTSARPFARSG